MLLKFLVAAFLLIAGANCKGTYDNIHVQSQMQQLMNGFVDTIDFYNDEERSFWYDHYHYLEPIIDEADASYPGNKVDGGWSTWYPLAPCLYMSDQEEDREEMVKKLKKYKKKENWVRPVRNASEERYLKVFDLSYANKHRDNHFWMAQLRIRYCTEKLPTNGGALCKGGNGMYETKIFYFQERDEEFLRGLPKKRKPEMNYCHIVEVFQKIRKLKRKGRKRLRTAVKLQSTYYDLY